MLKSPKKCILTILSIKCISCYAIQIWHCIISYIYMINWDYLLLTKQAMNKNNFTKYVQKIKTDTEDWCIVWWFLFSFIFTMNMYSEKKLNAKHTKWLWMHNVSKHIINLVIWNGTCLICRNEPSRMFDIHYARCKVGRNLDKFRPTFKSDILSLIIGEEKFSPKQK